MTGPTGFMSMIHWDRSPQRKNTLRMGPLFRANSLPTPIQISATERRQLLGALKQEGALGVVHTKPSPTR